MNTIYLLLKFLHLSGLIVAAGMIITTVLAYVQFWKIYDINKQQGLAALRSFKMIQVFAIIGLNVVLLSGLGMLIISDWLFVNMLWFQIKLVLIGLIFVNGFSLGRTSTMALHAFLDNKDSESNSKIDVAKLKSKVLRFQLVQILIYAGIVFLSILRFT